MNASTLTFYSYSSWLCFALSLVMLVFSHLRRGSYLVRSAAWALITLAIGFFFAGLAPVLPLWATVVSTNVVLLLPGLMMYSGVRAFITREPARLDRWGLGVVVLTLPFFFFWGLVEPDGVRRAVVFSVAATLIHARNSWHLLLDQWRKPLQLAPWTMAALFGTFSVWMALRTVHLLLADPLPTTLRAGNPTTWPTVFAMNILVTLFVISLLSAEVGQQKQLGRPHATANEGVNDPLRANLALLWGIVSAVLLAILSELGVAYLVLQQREQQLLREQNVLTNQALVAHAQQLIHQGDLMLRATRDLVHKPYPQPEIERFMASLNTQPAVFDGIYLIDAQGQVQLPARLSQRGLNAAGRDFFRFHQAQADDVLHIGQLATSPLNGHQQFHLSRRVNDAQGRFKGVLMIPVEPGAFSQYDTLLMSGSEKTALLAGTEDHRVRMRIPMLTQDRLDTPLESPLWGLLQTQNAGSFQSVSPLDGIEREYHFQQLSGWPLVMVAGFSQTDVQRNTRQSMQPIAVGTLLAIAMVLTMAFLLATALRRRDEQERFLSMISHELRTPMSVISMVAGADTTPSDLRERVLRAVGNMDTIIGRALQAERLRHGQVQAQGVSCDLNTLLTELVQASSNPARLHIDAQALPRCQTDPQLLRVILGNLLDNALKYSPPRAQVQVHAQTRSRHRQAGVAITVSNPVGVAGVPDSRRVFQKFYRASGARGKTGSGLGLHIADGLARLLGGRLQYRARTGEVQFTLWIPL